MNTLQKIAAAGLLVSSISGMVGCSSKDDSKETEQIINLGVDDLNPYPYIKYTGMVSDKVFTVSTGSNWSVNAYYPSSIKKFKFDGTKYELISVTADSLKIKYVKQ